jgi:hypothetical protein
MLWGWVMVRKGIVVSWNIKIARIYGCLFPRKML